MLHSGRAAGHEKFPGPKQRFAGEIGPSSKPVQWNTREGGQAWAGYQQTAQQSGPARKHCTWWVKGRNRLDLYLHRQFISHGILSFLIDPMKKTCKNKKMLIRFDKNYNIYIYISIIYHVSIIRFDILYLYIFIYTVYCMHWTDCDPQTQYSVVTYLSSRIMYLKRFEEGTCQNLNLQRNGKLVVTKPLILL